MSWRGTGGVTGLSLLLSPSTFRVSLRLIGDRKSFSNGEYVTLFVSRTRLMRLLDLVGSRISICMSLVRRKLGQSNDSAPL